MREEQSRRSPANFSHIFSPFSSPVMISTVTSGSTRHSFFFFLQPLIPTTTIGPTKTIGPTQTQNYTITTGGEDQMGYVIKKKKKRPRPSKERKKN